MCAGDRHQVDIVLDHVHRNLAERLHAVGVEQDAALVADLADLGHRLDHADFVVGVHDADQDGLVGDGVAQLIEIDQAVLLQRQIGDAAAMLFELLAGIENGLVLGRRRDDVVALFGVHLGHALDRQVVRFGGAAGEHDLFRVGADQVGDLLAGVVDGLFRLPSERVVAAGRIAEFFREVGQHRLQDARIHRRGGVVIKINGGFHVILNSVSAGLVLGHI